MQRIYRGHIYSYTANTPRPYAPPQAVNWRYRASDERYETNPDSNPSYHQPRAINWRYQ